MILVAGGVEHVYLGDIVYHELVEQHGFVYLECDAIGIEDICILGGDIIDYSSFGIFEWFIFINLAIIDVLLVWKLSTKVEQWIRKRRITKEERDDTDK